MATRQIDVTFPIYEGPPLEVSPLRLRTASHSQLLNVSQIGLETL